MGLTNWLRNIKHKRDWRRYEKAQKFWDSHDALYPTGQKAMNEYYEKKWARREKRIDRQLQVLSIVIGLAILSFGVLRYLKG